MNQPAVVIGSSREQRIPSLVLEHTILKRSISIPRIIHTYNKVFPAPKAPDLKPRTGFSFNRFAVPALAGYSGHAAYLECDQIVFRDVNDLFSLPMNEATVLRPVNQTSVLVLDCDKLNWDLPKIISDLDARKFTYHALMEAICIEPAKNISKTVPEMWNSLERYVAGETALLHYTNMATQPWRSKVPHPLDSIWASELRSAVQNGHISMRMITEDVSLGFLVPRILPWLQ